MKITVEHSAFTKNLSAVQTIIPGPRPSVPILSHVMIEAKDNLCTLTTTDLEMQMRATLPAIVSKKGNITVPVQLLFGIVRTLPEGSQIDLSLIEDGQLSLNVGKSRFLLHTIPANEFPKFDVGKLTHQFSLPAQNMHQLIEKTSFAISVDESRYYLNGIYFHIPKQDKTLRAVATDGYRLALCDVDLPEGAATMPGTIVPRKTVSEIARLIENSEAEADISLSKTMIRCVCDGITLTSKVVDGSFPDYARIIPDQHDKILTISNKDFSSTLQRVASIFVDPPPMVTPLVKLALGKNKLSLSSVCSGRGSAQEEIKIDYTADAIEIGFNPQYLLDITQQIDDEARIEMTSSDVAAVLRNANESKNQKSLYVLMPMRV